MGDELNLVVRRAQLLENIWGPEREGIKIPEPKVLEGRARFYCILNIYLPHVIVPKMLNIKEYNPQK